MAERVQRDESALVREHDRPGVAEIGLGEGFLAELATIRLRPSPALGSGSPEPVRSSMGQRTRLKRVLSAPVRRIALGRTDASLSGTTRTGACRLVRCGEGPRGS